jgi:hypothetical protein
MKEQEELNVKDLQIEKVQLLLLELLVLQEVISQIQSQQLLCQSFKFSGGLIKNLHKENISRLLIGHYLQVTMKDNWTLILIILIPNFHI